jgi:hypothetical protein
MNSVGLANEVILTGCVGDKLILRVLSLGRPSVPWVTHQVLSPVVGDLSPIKQSGEYTGIQVTGARKISRFFSEHTNPPLWGDMSTP